MAKIREHIANTSLVFLCIVPYVPSVKKGAPRGQDEKELKSKWAAKAGVVLVLVRIRF